MGEWDFTPDRVKKIRVLLGLSQGAFAHKLRVARNSVSLWELGENVPTEARILKALAEAEREVLDREPA